MDKITIVTNNVPRPLVYGFELSEKERKEFDYYDDDERLDCACFFRYKGWTYDLGEFTRVAEPVSSNCQFDYLKGWDGYSSDSFFSGVLVRYAEDNDYVIVGRYYS